MMYILPALAVYIFFMAYPMLDSIRLSLYNSNVVPREFVGLQNYIDLFTDKTHSTRFWGAFKNTWVFFFFHMAFQNVLGMLFAVILTNRTMRGKRFYHTIVFLPCTFAVTVTGYLFRMILSPVLSGPAFKSVGLDCLVYHWLGDEKTALAIVSLVSVWQWVGIPAMMFFAALQNVSEDVLEAAEIEGCNSWQAFWYIKYPLILPVVGMIAILTFVNNFNAFDIVYAMEGPTGPPNYATDLIGTLFYRVGVVGVNVTPPEPGIGAAISTSTFFMLLLGVIPTLKVTQTKE
ncbi:MAG TPA: sugar ABC transporter permease [Christensenellaceae bacterium]|jgi:raffinose/stachyose/melibiose transport system permease protein|nr:sugar ABC transporter permease [Christensenellaceae bacterium]